MFISTKASHMLLLQEIRSLKQDIQQANETWNELQTAQLMGEIIELKEQVDQMRGRLEIPQPQPKAEPEPPKTLNSQNRQ